ncbi:hypothetical protein B0F90DRAFT_1815213 [Multifurca ochricompacta]|uniref:4a-hydroxytetrahydrobiopterin dehydratase n=1 Tax=Multifurca ochricompacta TaxID=376703 RepID=A0AAD4M975_9AGAM|nr:hypothetical protein B0F90DRAFT_1815213 [Multifurca ochricompacta]
MQQVPRITLHGLRRYLFPRAFNLLLRPISVSRGQQVSIRFLSTEPTVAAKTFRAGNRPRNNKLLSVPSLPPPPSRLKGTPSIISTRDIEEYVQPLYLRGWGLAPILPNGNGIAVLRKRFDFANAEALHEFMTALREYEENQQHHAKTDLFEGQHAVLVSTWTHVARKRNGDINDKDIKTEGVTARDIRLAYALEKLFESALAASGDKYDPPIRQEADQPKTVEELEGYS